MVISLRLTFCQAVAMLFSYCLHRWKAFSQAEMGIAMALRPSADPRREGRDFGRETTVPKVVDV
jgi:hypothetical protein